MELVYREDIGDLLRLIAVGLCRPLSDKKLYTSLYAGLGTCLLLTSDVEDVELADCLLEEMPDVLEEFDWFQVGDLSEDIVFAGSCNAGPHRIVYYIDNLDDDVDNGDIVDLEDVFGRLSSGKDDRLPSIY